MMEEGTPVRGEDGIAMATESQSSTVRRFMRRIFASDAELDAEELQRDAVESGSTPAAVCRRGEMVSVTGRLRTVVYTPRTTLPTLEAELYDGSDMVTLVWLGRRSIPGIQPGASVTAKGRVAVRDNRKVIYNPHYELEAM
jgi:RecJ-like exonuclease